MKNRYHFFVMIIITVWQLLNFMSLYAQRENNIKLKRIELVFRILILCELHMHTLGILV